MKIYIGLGGVGCRTLQEFKEHCADTEGRSFFFIDSDKHSRIYDDGYVIPSLVYGTGMQRCIGRNAVIYDLYAGNLAQYFSGVMDGEEKIDLVFVLSSCGGFGGAAVSPLMDYLEAIFWHRLQSCVTISFNEGVYAKMGFPETILHQLEANTIDYVNDLSTREQAFSITQKYVREIFNPGCVSYLIDTTDISPENYWKYIEKSPEELQHLDCKARY